jgi:superfamily II DNA/RNA helicase
VLTEGVNLQQCRNIINLDIPWNPMRLVQRHGRIDRIGSLHPRVFLRTIFPAERLDQLLNLEQRILAKIAMAAASIGVTSPVDGAAHGQQVFTETREEIERLLREDPTLYERGGTANATQSGEEYRQPPHTALPYARA